MSRLLIRRQQRHHFLRIWAGLLVVLLMALGIWATSVAVRVRTHSLPVGDISLSVPYSTYLINEPITFTIKNNYNSAIFLANDCPQEPLSVYRLESNVWVRIHDTAQAADCPNENRQIQVPGGGVVNGNFAPWHKLFNQPGKYRVVAYVEYYSALPFQEFQVIATPQPFAATAPAGASPAAAGKTGPTTSSQTPTSGRQPTTGSSTNQTAAQPAAQSTPTPTPANYTPKHYTLGVNSSGNYAGTSLSLHPSDTITIVYNPPYNNEVITSFSRVAPTTATMSSVTVDSEFTSRTFTVMSVGTWTYKATDHNGNSGTLTVQ